MKPPLWLDVKGTGSKVTASLAKCRNCGKPKVTSDPCGLDHLAAILEFNHTRTTTDQEVTIPTVHLVADPDCDLHQDWPTKPNPAVRCETCHDDQEANEWASRTLGPSSDA